MAALSKRDIEMIFRAETDAATRPVNELTADVKKLRQGMEELAKASNKTDKSLDDLAKSTRDLEKAQEELSTARTLLTQLNNQANALERAETAAEKAGKKYNDLKAQVDGVEAPTKRLVNSLAAAERGLNANNARLEQARKDYSEVKASIESIIGPVSNLQDSFRQVAVAQRDITQGLTAAKGSVAAFKTEIALANTEADKLAANDAFKKAGAEAGLPVAQVQYLSQFENRVELLAKARRELIAQDAAFRQAVEAQEAKVGAANVAQLKEQFEQASIAAARLEQVDAFRKLAADSIAATSATDRIAASINNASTPAQRLATEILKIVNPAAAVSSTLDGMDERLNSVVAKLAGGKISVAEWGQLNNELQGVQAGLIRAAAEVDKFTAQQDKVSQAAAAYDQQAAKVRELAAAEISASTNVEELTADIQREEAALRRLGGALDSETAKLREFGTTLKSIGVDSNNLPNAMQRIEATATRAAPAISRVANAVTPGGRRGFLGLDPYQLQNLSFQVNDVFTSLASGISPMQTLAQQGGQIVQIFPGIISSFAAWLPLIAPVGVAIGVLAASIGEANNQLQILRTANATLSSLGNSGGATVAQVQSLAQTFRDFGESVDDALTATKIMVKEGLDPKYYEDFAIAAKNASDVQGKDLKTTTEEITKAFTEGAAEVLKLDDQYNFLTNSQRDQLSASKDTKDETEEVRKAFDSLFKTQQDGANDMNTVFKDATNNLNKAWQDFLGTLSNTGIVDSMANALANVLIGASAVLNFIKQVNGQVVSNRQSNKDAIIERDKQIRANPANAAKINSDFSKRLAQGITPDKRSVKELWADAEKETLKQMADTRKRLDAAQGATGKKGVNLAGGSQGEQKAQEAAAAKAKKDAAKAAKKAASDAEAEAKRRAAEAKRLAKQYENEQDQLSSQLSRFTAQAMQGQQAPLQQQLDLAKQAVDEQFKALEDRLSEFREKFGKDAKINGMSQADYSAALSAQKAQLVLNKQLGVYESNINDLLKSRDEKLKSIKEAQDAGLLSAQDALDQTKEVTSSMGPQIDAAIESARQFIATLQPSAATQAMLDKFARIQQQGGGANDAGTINRGQAESGVKKSGEEINKIFQQRATLIDAANKLYDIGAINFTQKEDRIKAAYAGTNAVLKEQIATLSEYLEKNKDILTPETYALATAQLQEYNAQLQYTTTLQQAVQQSAQQAIENGVMTMFDSLAQGIANVITGAGSLKDLFSDLGRAALDFAAQFLQAIAQAIVQTYALRIAMSLTGGSGGGGFFGNLFKFHGGGTVGDYGRGVMRSGTNFPVADLSSVPRYHNGVQGAGLKSNEMLAVLQKGENVQTEEQQRIEANRLKAAKAGQGDRGLRQVLAIGDAEVASAMSGAAGEDVFLTFVQRNRATLKQMIGNA